MRSRVALFALGILAAGACSSALVGTLAPGVGRSGMRRLLFGSPLLVLRQPVEGQILPEGGVEVFVSFADSNRVAAETFRCLLNGRDVTAELTRGRNGAVGSLVGAIEGDNRLRVEVFGRNGWLDRYLEDWDEVVFRVRPLLNLDRA